MHTMTAEALMQHLGNMPAQERSRFFSLLGQQAFHQENLSHADVFGHLVDADFTAAEAAEYLEVSMPTLRRFVRDGKLVAHAEVGRSQLFSVASVKAFKRHRQAVKG